MKIEILKGEDGRVPFDSLESGECFCQDPELGLYFIKALFRPSVVDPDPTRNARATQVDTGEIKLFGLDTPVLPVKAKVVIG